MTRRTPISTRPYTLFPDSTLFRSITDHEMEHILERAAEAGAKAAFFLPVRLPYEVAPLFRAWLDTHFPDRADKVMNTIRSIRSEEHTSELQSLMRTSSAVFCLKK